MLCQWFPHCSEGFSQAWKILRADTYSTSWKSLNVWTRLAVASAHTLNTVHSSSNVRLRLCAFMFAAALAYVHACVRASASACVRVNLRACICVCPRSFACMRLRHIWISASGCIFCSRTFGMYNRCWLLPNSFETLFFLKLMRTWFRLSKSKHKDKNHLNSASNWESNYNENPSISNCNHYNI